MPLSPTRILERREMLGLSKSEAARQAGVRWQTWQQIEQGRSRPQTETLEAIARVLGVSVGWLLGAE